ncbi:lysylphosphatidylglycerol synthase transmembrane domain-containing protein [Gallibacterium salpingitidis]|uniref:Uncharacterized protein n=1 Tax=Gallibacterium salpingitidis TaxID=505341 RepID=A0A1A7P007_9PAST|nr:lysylphosphatidylglycerol synthase transmembrane domain-containing protein [Gallibacterium salpingitidis]OBW95298.1 hypothetical protein QS62_04055 [Gallibacterium salpingitidis]
MFLIFFSIIFMIIGHLYKVRRWGLYISIYETPNYGNLLNALSVGHILNIFFPLTRLGDIVRILISGRKLKNGYPFSIATVIADLYIDLLTVGLFFIIFTLYANNYIKDGGGYINNIASYYIVFMCIVIFITMLIVINRKWVKKYISIFSTIFNENIEFGLLYTSYLSIASIKDIILNINRIKFFIYSIIIWGSYILSYILFSKSIYEFYNDESYSVLKIFSILFSGLSVYQVDNNILYLWLVFLLSPLLICFVISYSYNKYSKNSKNFNYKIILPQLSKTDKLAFLRIYYAEENREHIKNYIKMNKNVVIIEDFSAGSNASTILIIKNDQMYFRKYAFDDDGVKLAEQVDWIEHHGSDIPLPLILNKRIGGSFCSYDMYSYASAVGLFKYIHTMPIANSWSILESALNDISFGLYSKNNRKADDYKIKEYIFNKIYKNLEIIKNKNKYIMNLEKFEEVRVNGKQLKTLRFYEDMFEFSHLYNIFKDDWYSDIHGDLTIENIVCLSNPYDIDKCEYEFMKSVIPDNYYFIDPNTGNLHDSPFLDYAKLLQSLHGNYEFLMMVNNVSIDEDNVNYLLLKTEIYGKIYKKYRDYLLRRFDKKEILSIYYHEVVHWLRLMPYKIRKDEKLSVVFYTGLLQVLADVWRLENNG